MGLVGGAIVLGFDPIARSWVTEAGASPSSCWLPQLDGTLSVDAASRAAAADDFGHIVHRTPVAVLHAGSVSDIVKMVKFARCHDLQIASRGRGHTTLGQAQSAELVIDLSGLNQIHAIGSTFASVDAGLMWRDLLLVTTPLGLSPPVLPDFTNITVGGTLSVGGVGGRSHQYGAQLDNVLELLVVTGEGDVVTCSPFWNRKLFEAALGGLGLCAVIVRATVRLIPVKPRARTFQLFYPDATSMLDGLRILLGDNRFEYYRGTSAPVPGGGWAYFIEATKFYAVPEDPSQQPGLLDGLGFIPGATQVTDHSYFEFCDEVVQLIAALAQAGLGGLPHPWLDLFVPDSAVDAFVTQTIAGLDPALFLPGSIMLFYPFFRSQLDRPLLRVPEEEVFFLFDILRTVPPDPSVLTAVLQENRGYYEENLALGGTQYVISAIPMTSADWQTHFGSAWMGLRQAKRKYDPHNVLGAGLAVFPACDWGD
jgi:FAD/FMN-containing dehydrogenase